MGKFVGVGGGGGRGLKMADISSTEADVDALITKIRHDGTGVNMLTLVRMWTKEWLRDSISGKGFKRNMAKTVRQHIHFLLPNQEKFAPLLADNASMINTLYIVFLTVEGQYRNIDHWITLLVDKEKDHFVIRFFDSLGRDPTKNAQAMNIVQQRFSKLIERANVRIEAPELNQFENFSGKSCGLYAVMGDLFLSQPSLITLLDLMPTMPTSNDSNVNIRNDNKMYTFIKNISQSANPRG